MPRLSASYRGEWHSAVERSEAAAMPDCEREQIDIRDLFRSEDAIPIDQFDIEQGYVGRPEGVAGRSGLLREELVR